MDLWLWSVQHCRKELLNERNTKGSSKTKSLWITVISFLLYEEMKHLYFSNRFLYLQVLWSCSFWDMREAKSKSFSFSLRGSNTFFFFLTTDQVTMWSAFIEFFLQRNFPCYSIQRCSAIFPSLPPALPNKWQLLSVLNSWYESYYLQDNFFSCPTTEISLCPEAWILMTCHINMSNCFKICIVGY